LDFLDHRIQHLQRNVFSIIEPITKTYDLFDLLIDTKFDHIIEHLDLIIEKIRHAFLDPKMEITYQTNHEELSLLKGYIFSMDNEQKIEDGPKNNQNLVPVGPRLCRFFRTPILATNGYLHSGI